MTACIYTSCVREIKVPVKRDFYQLTHGSVQPAEVVTLHGEKQLSNNRSGCVHK